MKPILIIYPFDTQHSLMTSLAERLNNKGETIDLLCLFTGELICQSNASWNKGALSLLRMASMSHNSFYKTVYSLFLRWIFSLFYFPKIMENYRAIDFHSFNSLEYILLMKKCRAASIPYDITLWGSEVLRASDRAFGIRKVSYCKSRYIKGAGTLIDVLKCKYKDIPTEHFVENYFGNSELDVIDKIDDKLYNKLYSRLFNDVKKKIIIVCGYNNQPAQQHALMIKAISELNDELKSKIHVVLPLTYPKNEEYQKQIIQLMDSTDISYNAIVNYLAIDEVAVLRKAADIVINIQTTDAFAAAIQSHLYCTNIVILGEWLNYPLYDKNNIFYIKSGINNLSSQIIDAINNFEKYKTNCIPNKNIIRNLVSWDACINGWAEAYEK